MRVINPKHQSPVEAFAQANKVTVETYLTNNADQAEITFDQIRADFPGVADPKTGQPPMTDGTIAEIFKALGYQVTE